MPKLFRIRKIKTLALCEDCKKEIAEYEILEDMVLYPLTWSVCKYCVKKYREMNKRAGDG
jgi:hypothetical protein